MVARKRFSVTLNVHCLSCFTELVVSSGNTSDIFWRFLIRVSAEAPDMPTLIKTFFLLLCSCRQHQPTVNYLDISLRAPCGRLPRRIAGSTPMNYLDIFRGIDGEFSRCVSVRLTENYLNILFDISLWNFNTFFRLFHGKFYRYFIGCLKVN